MRLCIKRIILVLSVLFFYSYAFAGSIYRTRTSKENIKSLQVKVAGEVMSEPYININDSRFIEISFDALHEGYKDYTYSIIHCDANWNKSSLIPLEYMDGFQQMLIDDYAPSIGTSTQYTHYRLTFPNNDVQLKVSGNYAVQIFKAENPSVELLTACFSIVDPLVNISGEISGNTNIDTYNKHQQVNFTLHLENAPASISPSELTTKVIQNGRADNVIIQPHPTNITPNTISYTHQKDLIFEGGNEYRRIEFLSHRYNGLGVEMIRFYNPYYHVLLQTNESRKNNSYNYDQDQNGRFFVRCSSCDDPDIEADYYVVHFSLCSQLPLPGNVYIAGELFQNMFTEANRMEYNVEEQLYEKSVLLKQGNYNYQYLHVPHGSTQGESASIEGSFYQTENEYTILVYYRPPGARFDQLIGKKTLKSQPDNN